MRPLFAPFQVCGFKRKKWIFVFFFAGSTLHSDTLQNKCRSCFPYELSSGLCNISMNFLMLHLNRREQRARVKKREPSAVRLRKLGLGAVLHADC